MCTRVSRPALCVVWACLILTGCGWQGAPKGEPEVGLLATGPDQEALSIPPDYASAAIEAAGGLSAWIQARELMFGAVVTMYDDDGSCYLTEHGIEAYPWSNAIRISSREPRARFVWQVVDGEYAVKEGGPQWDVSPLGESYRDYAEALLQIVTTPARVLTPGLVLARRPVAVKIQGQSYDPIEARFPVQKVVLTEKGDEEVVAVEPYWTNAVYFQNHQSKRIDSIWLGNLAKQRFLMVRGYDYAVAGDGGVLTPGKIEVFRTDPEENVGRRLIQVDVKQ